MAMTKSSTRSRGRAGGGKKTTGGSSGAGGDVAKLAKLIKEIQFAMLTTARPDGTLRSRPMASRGTPLDGELWFFTGADSGKVHEIEDDQHVNLAYADAGDNTYVSISGRASLVRDKRKAKELWNPIYKAWFPRGLDDPNLALLRVTIEQAEYWDHPSSKMVQLYGYVKAVLTGKPATTDETGDHAKLTMRPRAKRAARRK